MSIRRQIWPFLLVALPYFSLFGAPKDHGDETAKYELELSRLSVNCVLRG